MVLVFVVCCFVVCLGVVGVPVGPRGRQMVVEPTTLPFLPKPTFVTTSTTRTSIQPHQTVWYETSDLLVAAQLFVHDVKQAIGLELNTQAGLPPNNTAGIVLRIDSHVCDDLYVAGADDADSFFPQLQRGSYALDVLSNGSIIISGASVQGALHGSITLLQTLYSQCGSQQQQQTESCEINTMSIKDKPFRRMRALSIDLNTSHFHSVQAIETFIVLCRLYKISVLTFNTGRAQWMGMVMNSISQMNETYRHGGATKCYEGHCMFYTQEEMQHLVRFGAARGVRLVPYAQTSPQDPLLIQALATKYNPNATSSCFMDEIDGLGPSTYNGVPDVRFWNYMHTTLTRFYNLFASGWPNNDIPMLHIGPVLGEGGMNDTEAKAVFDLVRKISPTTKVQFWNGLCASCQDQQLHPLFAVRDACVVNFYTKQYSESDIFGYIDNGWHVINSAWAPLYVLGPQTRQLNAALPPNSRLRHSGDGPWSVQETWEQFNLFRTGTDADSIQEVDWDMFDNSTTNNFTVGAELSTWEMAFPTDFVYVRSRLAAMADHAWTQLPWPYNNEGETFDDFEARLSVFDKLLEALTPSSPAPVPPGFNFGGRIELLSARVPTNFSLVGSLSAGGIAGADQLCSHVLGLQWKAFLVDETGCDGQPCRRATVTPNKGDDQIDWVLKPNSAYFHTDNQTLVGVTNENGLFVWPLSSAVGLPVNQLTGMRGDWTTWTNGTCQSWTCGASACGGVNATLAVGWAASVDQGLLQGSYSLLGCGAGPLICVEQ